MQIKRMACMVIVCILIIGTDAVPASAVAPLQSEVFYKIL